MTRDTMNKYILADQYGHIDDIYSFYEPDELIMSVPIDEMSKDKRYTEMKHDNSAMYAALRMLALSRQFYPELDLALTYMGRVPYDESIYASQNYDSVLDALEKSNMALKYGKGGETNGKTV